MKPSSLGTALFGAGIVMMAVLLVAAPSATAQVQPGRVQQIAGRLQPGEIHAYLLSDLQAGDRLTISMRTTAGNLDPGLGILDTATPLAETMTRFRADVQRLVAENQNVALALEDLRNQYFLAWDDDSGDGYAAALEYVVPAAGDYSLIAAGSLTALGRATSGDYELLIGLNAPSDEVEAAGAPIAERIPGAWGLSPSVEEASGTLTPATPMMSLGLADIGAGETLTVYVEATSGNLIPMAILRDYGGKALEAGNLGGQEPQATLQHTMTEPAVGYRWEVRAGALPDGSVTEGGYRVLVGVNAPDVLTGQAQPQGAGVLATPIEVQAGLKILRISEVDSPNEKFTVLGSMRMDWTDPDLAFSPDSCNCSVKLYSDKEVDRFLVDVGSRWPAFTFFNQLGNRWIQSRAAAIWPDGRARYAENFNTTFQGDFDFRRTVYTSSDLRTVMDVGLPMTELPATAKLTRRTGKTSSSSRISRPLRAP
jgi:hypothetical protein